MNRTNKTKESLHKLFNSSNIKDINSMSCLDMFGKDGYHQTDFFYEKCKNITVNEINSDYIEILKNKFPNASVNCLDSVEEISSMKMNEKIYDLIIIDAPLMLYCDNKYCEHFDVLPHIDKLFKDECYILINVITHPYNVDDEENYNFLQVRKKYYDVIVNEKNILSLTMINDFYVKKFKEYSLKADIVGINCREIIDDIEYLHHVLIKLSK